MRLCPGCSFRFGDYCLFRARQEYNEASSGLSGSRPTIDDLNRPAMLVHDFRYDREPEAYTAFLRREKWIKNLNLRLAVHTNSGVDDGKHHRRSGFHLHVGGFDARSKSTPAKSNVIANVRRMEALMVLGFSQSSRRNASSASDNCAMSGSPAMAALPVKVWMRRYKSSRFLARSVSSALLTMACKLPRQATSVGVRSARNAWRSSA